MSFVQVKRWLREPVPPTGVTPRFAMLCEYFNPFDGGIGPDDEARQSDLCVGFAEYPGFWDGLPAGLTPTVLVRAFAVAAELHLWGFEGSAREGDGGSEIGFGDWLQLALAQPRRCCRDVTTRRAVAFAGTEAGCVG